MTIAGLDFGNLFDGGVDESADLNDDIIAMHFHNAARGVNGPNIFNIFNQDQYPLSSKRESHRSAKI